LAETDFEEASLAEGLEEAIEEYLGLAFFVAGDVDGDPVDKFLPAAIAICGHAVSIHNRWFNTSRCFSHAARPWHGVRCERRPLWTGTGI
jgi:hypothetical protein